MRPEKLFKSISVSNEGKGRKREKEGREELADGCGISSWMRQLSPIDVASSSVTVAVGSQPSEEDAPSLTLTGRTALPRRVKRSAALLPL